MWKRFQGDLVLAFLRQRRNLFVENYNTTHICPSGATLSFSTLLKPTGCAAGAEFTMLYLRSYKQVTPLAYIQLH